MVLEGAMHAVRGEMQASISPRYESCKLQLLSWKDKPAGATVARGLWDQPLLLVGSDLLYEKKSIPWIIQGAKNL